MKTLTLTALALIIFFLNACTQSSSSSSNNATLTAITAQNIAMDGTWRISYFFDKTNETILFNGYVFSFGTGGSATAAKAGNTNTGTWSTANDDNTVKFVVNFGNTSPLDELQGDWHIINATSAEIKLADVSGGKSETDYLTFTKN